MMIDLHTHTTASDGTLSPAELISLARTTGIRVLAVTDHDTFAGADACRDFVQGSELHLIPGVELSTSLDVEMHKLFRGKLRDIHLLAYFPNGKVPDLFRKWVEDLGETRWARNRELLASLAKQGVVVEEEELRARGGNVAGRVHLGNMLLERGLVASLEEAFIRFLGENAATYVPRQSPPISVALKQIRLAGGISSLAHPIRFWGHDWESGEGLTPRLAEAGLDALEAWHSEQSAEYSARVLEVAGTYGLRVTGGSDFHGANKPGIHLGRGYGDDALVPRDMMEQVWAGVPYSLLAPHQDEQAIAHS
jgi:predicted metal-dependent phosphoesterase TrpH